MHDAVRVFSAALREFTIFNELSPQKFDCAEDSEPWEQGAELLKKIDEVCSDYQYKIAQAIHAFLS